MPHYHFEKDDGDRLIGDEEGLELADAEAARQQALATLPSLARSVVPGDGDHRVIAVTVRDAAGGAIYTATLTLVGAWCEGHRTEGNPDH